MRILEDDDSIYIVTAVTRIPVVARDHEEALRIAGEFGDNYTPALSVSRARNDYVWDEWISKDHPLTRRGCASTSVRALLFERRERNRSENEGEG